MKEEPSSAGRLARGVNEEFPDRWALAPPAFKAESELSRRLSIGARLLLLLSDGDTESDK